MPVNCHITVTEMCEWGGMNTMKRYAIYYAPPAGEFATRAAQWLGWDVVDGCAAPQPALDGVDLDAATRTSRKYGFHATIKAPFRLADGQSADDLAEALDRLAGHLRPVALPALRFDRIAGRFLALRPDGNEGDLRLFAAEVVARLDGFRAPLSEAEIARRNPAALTPRQRELMGAFGYPYVLEEFHFHLTLSGDLPPETLDLLEPAARDWFAPVMPKPFQIGDLCLFGEDMEGRFHLLSRHALTG